MQQKPFLTTYEETKSWLDYMKIDNYTINPKTLEVDANGVVIIRGKGLKQIPVKFNNVVDIFDCSCNKLTSLVGSPKNANNSFYCYENKLQSLKGAPEYVGRKFHCDHNLLTSLNGAPAYVGGDLLCHINLLTSLQGAPNYIGGSVLCNSMGLQSLQGCPPNLNTKLVCPGNNAVLSTIDKFIKSVPHIALVNVAPDLSMFMRVFFIKNLKQFEIYDASPDQHRVVNIINKHLQSDRSGPACQIELIDAGLGQYIKI